MAFQDGIAAADIHDISGHRKFIREKKNAAFVYTLGNLWNLTCVENYSKTVTDLYETWFPFISCLGKEKHILEMFDVL